MPRNPRKTAIISAGAIAIAAVAAPAAAGDQPIGRAGSASGDDSAQYRLTVGTNGRARACTVERSSGDASADAVACHFLIRRGEWRSRRDEQGRRIEYEMSIELLRDFLNDLPR